MEPQITSLDSELHEETLVDEEVSQQLMQRLPKTSLMGISKAQVVNYEGFWCPAVLNYFTSILAFQRHFEAHDTDLIVSSFPKTGTTWLKSLLFSVVNRRKFPIEEIPLHNKNPHELVYCLEVDVYGNAFDYPRPNHLNELPSPRLFNTHLPYTSLPKSIKDSKCKILYVGRNPMDTFVSLWFFTASAMRKLEGDDYEPPSMEEYFECFCEGKVVHGPYFDHVVEYWKQSLERPEKMLFLKYEDLKDDPKLQLKKLSEFVGVPFTTQEESEGVIEKIIELCSIGNLKEMEVNKSGVFNRFYEKKS